MAVDFGLLLSETERGPCHARWFSGFNSNKDNESGDSIDLLPVHLIVSDARTEMVIVGILYFIARTTLRACKG